MTAVTWDGLDAKELARRCGVPRLELFAETESTQDVALWNENEIGRNDAMIDALEKEFGYLP